MKYKCSFDANYYNAIPYIPILGIVLYYVYQDKITSFERSEGQTILQIFVLLAWHIVISVLSLIKLF